MNGLHASFWAMVAVALLGTACKPRPAVQTLPPPVVQVMAVLATNVALTTEFIGQLDSPQNVEVRARVEAFVDAVLFIEGTNVNQGDSLYRLDRRPFLERLAAAKGSLAEAQAGLNKYEKDVARLQPLAEKRAIPRQDLDNAVASVEVGRASVLSAEARVKSAELDLDYCEVRAPMSGRIGARQVSVGDLVGKGEPTLLATISQLDPIWFYCNLSEVDYLRAERKAQEHGRKVGELPVTLILADGSELPTPGRWVFIDRAVDTTTGTLRLRAQFDNPSELLRPGMFARARISLKTDRDSLVIPQRAVQELQGLHFVWVVDAGSKVSQRQVKVGARVGSDWIIENGLTAGDRIVVEGLQKVREGAAVQPMTAAEMARAAASASAKE
ncbi:MAG: efflux RND transporter periplasmic adaptor subunit [Limisphaerales bacterium]